MGRSFELEDTRESEYSSIHLKSAMTFTTKLSTIDLLDKYKTLSLRLKFA